MCTEGTETFDSHVDVNFHANAVIPLLQHPITYYSVKTCTNNQNRKHQNRRLIRSGRYRTHSAKWSKQRGFFLYANSHLKGFDEIMTPFCPSVEQQHQRLFHFRLPRDTITNSVKITTPHSTILQSLLSLYSTYFSLHVHEKGNISSMA